LRDQKDEILQAIALTPFSREEFAVSVASNGELLPPVERARRFYVRARQARTGLAQTASLGRWANCKNTSRNGMAGAVSRWLNGLEGLSEVALRLLRVQIENRPAIDVMREYDSADMLFYCDPPYPHSSRGDSRAYEFEMSDEEHRVLAGVLKDVRAKVALSGYRCDLLNDLYSDWRLIENSRTCHSVKQNRVEALWVNY
jgi:DNA adenine methylase